MRLSHLFPDKGFRRLVVNFEQDAANRINSLTPQQRLVMEQMLDGHANKEIAYRMGISQRTVENHRSAIFERTGAKSLPDLLRYAILAEMEFNIFATGENADE